MAKAKSFILRTSKSKGEVVLNFVLVSRDEELKGVLKRGIPEYPDVYVFDSIDDASLAVKDVAVVLLDGKCVVADDFEKVRRGYPETEIIYTMHNIKANVISKHLQMLAMAHSVDLIGEHRTADQIVKQVRKILFKESDASSRRIVSFFGTHSGAGVSTTTLNISKLLGNKIAGDVLLITLNPWDSGDYHYNYKKKNLNDLKVDLRGKSLNPERLKDACNYYDKTFYHLAGNKDIKLQRYFTNEEIDYLLHVALKTFELVIVDGGAHFDTAATTQAYIQGGSRFLITTQEQKGYRGNFPLVFDQLIKPTGGTSEDFGLIVNQYEPDSNLPSDSDISSELGMAKIVTIPDVGKLSKIASYQEKMLVDMGKSIYLEPLTTLANYIIKASGVKEDVSEKSEKKSSKKSWALWG